MTNDVEMTKIELRVDDGDGEVTVETPWATPLGGNRFRLENSPFYAYEVSWEDVIEAIPESDGGFPVFRRILEKSGNRTVRVIFDPPVENGNVSDVLLNQIVDLGCSYEGANRKYIAINIPKETDLTEVCSFLASRNLQWEHADPSYDELYPDNA